VTEPVVVPVGDAALRADLTLPDAARSVVLFAHGSGSGRLSPRNRQVAAGLHRRGLATLLLDLLTEREERDDRRDGRLRFDIELLADRLTGALDWLGADPRTAGLPIGIFGASTGAAAALVTAARRPDRTAAVVSRGGRPDLAGEWLAAVRAPVLLIVGGADPAVLRLNEQAARELADAEVVVVPGATHLFEEPGALERVTDLAGAWFLRHLVPPARPAGNNKDPAVR
jgi:dienelactone hydrolase